MKVRVKVRAEVWCISGQPEFALVSLRVLLYSASYIAYLAANQYSHLRRRFCILGAIPYSVFRIPYSVFGARF